MTGRLGLRPRGRAPGGAGGGTARPVAGGGGRRWRRTQAAVASGGELASRQRPSRSISAFTRVVAFLQGSWRELQRVQWPDRRQVMQATGVVLGFVIVAGVYLGVADWVAQKIVHLILTK